MSLLEVKNLNVTFNTKNQAHQIVKDLSFSVEEGECLGIIGESGSGKSITTKAIMGILDHNFHVTGSVKFKGKDLLKENKESLRKRRGKEITMILQNPMICFDSLYRIDYQIAETFREHTDWDKSTIYQKSIELLEKMKIKEPSEVLKKYPHQLSGGMLQRIMIGIALALDPDIIIADEPTTAIDSITRYEIMKEFKQLKDNHSTMIFITHDLNIASFITDHVIVMKNGKKIDSGTIQKVLTSPQDKYTKDLVENQTMLLQKYKQCLRNR